MNHFMTEVLHAENNGMDTCVLKAEELRTEKEKKPTKKNCGSGPRMSHDQCTRG